MMYPFSHSRCFAKKCFFSLLISCSLLSPQATLAQGKLIGTSGASQVEGSAGGGIVPWAIIAGNGTQDEFGGAGHASIVEMDDLMMTSYGMALGVYDRYEFSFARMSAQNKINADVLRQNVFGLKVRVAGDIIYSSVPQIAVGMQYKKLDTSSDTSSIGFEDDAGVDVYLAATKVWLDGPWHRNALLNLTLRYSEANQLGLLGFGSQDDDSNPELLLETSAGIFLNRNWVIGAEYRQKPDNLSSLPEDDWFNFFASYIPEKSLSFVIAYMNTGEVGGSDDQTGLYLSVKGAF